MHQDPAVVVVVLKAQMAHMAQLLVAQQHLSKISHFLI